MERERERAGCELLTDNHAYTLSTTENIGRYIKVSFGELRGAIDTILYVRTSTMA
jgi:hypothetical protein